MDQEAFKTLFGKRFRQALIENLKQSDLTGPLNVSDKQISVYDWQRAAFSIR